MTGHWSPVSQSPIIQALDKLTGHLLPVTGHRPSSHWSKSPGKYHRASCLDKITGHLSPVTSHRSLGKITRQNHRAFNHQSLGTSSRSSRYQSLCRITSDWIIVTSLWTTSFYSQSIREESNK